MIFNFSRKKNYPVFYKNYLEKISDEGFSTDLIALDMETTGIDVKKSEIISFGSILVKDNKLQVSDYCHMFYEHTSQDDENIKIHEILPNAIKGRFEDSIEEVIERIDNKIILGHFVEFDIALINQSLKKLGLPKIKNPSKDTLKLALKHDNVTDYNYVNKEDYTLYALCKRFGIEIFKTHDALHDSELSALLYLFLVK